MSRDRVLQRCPRFTVDVGLDPEHRHVIALPYIGHDLDQCDLIFLSFRSWKPREGAYVGGVQIG